MSINVALLKILSSYPEGRASYASLKADLALLATHEWLARMRALGDRAGNISLFRLNLVARDAGGWTITAAGREFLRHLESGDDIMPRSEAPPALRLVASNIEDAAMPDSPSARH